MRKISIFTVLLSAGIYSLSGTSNAYEYTTGESSPIYYDALEKEYNSTFGGSSCDSNDADCNPVKRNKVKYTSNNRQFQSGKTVVRTTTSETKSTSQQNQYPTGSYKPTNYQSASNYQEQGGYQLGPLESAFEIQHPTDGWEFGLNHYTGTSHFEFTTSTNSKLKWLNMDTKGFELNARKYWTSDKNNSYFIDMSLGRGTTSTDYTTDDDITNPLVVFSAGTGDGETEDYKIGFGYKSNNQILGFDTRYVFGFKRKNQNLRMLGHKQPVTNYLTNCGTGTLVADTDGNYPSGLCAYTFTAGSSIEGFLSPENIEYRDLDGNGTFDVFANYGTDTTPDFDGDANITIYIPLGNLIQAEDNEYEVQEAYFSDGTNSAYGMIDMNNTQMETYFGDFAFVNEISGPNEPTQIYDVTWDGIYAGIELEKAMSMRDYLKFYGEVFYGKYSANGNWPVRGLTFKDESSSAMGFSLSAEYNYIMKDNVTFFAGWSYDYLSMSDADTTYPDGYVEEGLVEEAFWRYNGFKLGLRAGF